MLARQRVAWKESRRMRAALFFFFAVVTPLLHACSASNEGAPAASPPADEAPPAGTGETASADAAAPPPDAATPSKGCTVAPVGVGAVTTKSIAAAGKDRTYHLSVPADLVAKKAVPLVFVHHGAGDTSPENMRDWFAVESHMPGAIYAYPQALPRTRSDGSGGDVPRWDLTGNEDLAFFDAMLGAVSDAYCVDRSRVFVTGFSSGGNFSQQLACLRQKDVKAMAVVAGPGPFVPKCDGPVPVWMTHDVNDDTLPIADARSSRDFWAAENGCGKTWAHVSGRPECQRNTSCPTTAGLVYCETTGVGHDVPPFAVASIGAFFAALPAGK